MMVFQGCQGGFKTQMCSTSGAVLAKKIEVSQQDFETNSCQDLFISLECVMSKYVEYLNAAGGSVF